MSGARFKRLVRARMAQTGENYRVAVQRLRESPELCGCGHPRRDHHKGGGPCNAACACAGFLAKVEAAP